MYGTRYGFEIVDAYLHANKFSQKYKGSIRIFKTTVTHARNHARTQKEREKGEEKGEREASQYDNNAANTVLCTML